MSRKRWLFLACLLGFVACSRSERIDLRVQQQNDLVTVTVTNHTSEKVLLKPRMLGLLDQENGLNLAVSDSTGRLVARCLPVDYFSSPKVITLTPGQEFEMREDARFISHAFCLQDGQSYVIAVAYAGPQSKKFPAKSDPIDFRARIVEPDKKKKG